MPWPGRVGIIDRGRLAAQGTPEDLKRARGSDLIIAKLEGDADAAAGALQDISSIARIDVHGQELTLSVSNGAAVISSVALAFARGGVGVQELTLRTPSLDDVFLQVTGARLQDSVSGPVQEAADNAESD